MSYMAWFDSTEINASQVVKHQFVSRSCASYVCFETIHQIVMHWCKQVPLGDVLYTADSKMSVPGHRIDEESTTAVRVAHKVFKTVKPVFVHFN